MEFVPVAGLSTELGEGPVWDERRNLVFLCDISGYKLHALSLDEGLQNTWTFESEVCSLGLCESGRLVIALRKDVILFDPESGERETIATPGLELETNRLNDGKVGADGCFWVGSVDQRAQREPVAALYRVSSDGSCDVKKTGLLVSNGLAWTADGTTMFHSDSAGRWIDRHAFDPSTGTFDAAVRIATPDEAMGRPDGAACDAEGYYWSAGVSAACLNRFSPEGVLVAKYPVPVAAPTMPCFCGPDLKTLLVTSHRQATPERMQSYPLTGSVLLARSDVAGAPVSRMKGV